MTKRAEETQKETASTPELKGQKNTQEILWDKVLDDEKAKETARLQQALKDLGIFSIEENKDGQIG